MVPLSQRGWEVIESSGSRGASLAASLLKGGMMSLCTVLVAHGGRYALRGKCDEGSQSGCER